MRSCLAEAGATAELKINEYLESFQPDIVVIGAGVRTDSDHLLLLR